MKIQCPNCFEYYENDVKLCSRCGYVQGVCIQEAPYMSMGSILQKRYRIGGVLHYSSYDVFYLAWDMMLEKKVVIREYLPREFSARSPGGTRIRIFNGSMKRQFMDGLERFAAEAKHLSVLQNEPEIVDIFDSFLENNTAYIVMEYLEGVTLTTYLEQEKSLKPELAIVLLTAIIRSLEIVCTEDVLPWNIAPENIIITKSGEVKLVKLQGGHRTRPAPRAAPGEND